MSVDGHLTTEIERSKTLSSDRDYWKTAAETREATISERNEEIKKLSQKVGVQVGSEQIKAELDTTKATLEKTQQRASDFQAEIARLKQEVAGEIEQRSVYKKLADDERKRTTEKLAETERLHKENRDMISKIERLRSEIKSLGYVPGA